MTQAVAQPAMPAVRQHTHWSDRVAQAALLAVVALLLGFLAMPLLAILQQALQGNEGEFVGLKNFVAYARTPALLESLSNSLWVSVLVTVLTVPPAFGFAYALTRSCMPLKPLFRGITLIPDRKSTRLNSSHVSESRMPSSA